MKTKEILSRVLRIAVAVIFIQTLYYKFTAHPDSVHIFSSLGLEPVGRIGLGVVELISSVLLLVPRTKLIGIFISFGIICGAILSHFIVLGLDVQEDGGALFSLALIIFACCSVLFGIHKSEFMTLIKERRLL